MPTKPGTRIFGGPIAESLKNQIEEQAKTTKLPMGRIIETLAEWWVSLDPDDQRRMCYGVSFESFGDYIRSQVAEYIRSPEGAAAIEEAVAGSVARESIRTRERPAHRSRRPGG